MKIALNYFLTILLCYVFYIIVGYVALQLQSINHNVDGKVYIILPMMGIIFSPIFIVANLTQFLLLIDDSLNLICFFAPVILVLLISILAFENNMMDAYLWIPFSLAQLIVSILVNWLYTKSKKTT